MGHFKPTTVDKPMGISRMSTTEYYQVHREVPTEVFLYPNVYSKTVSSPWRGRVSTIAIGWLSNTQSTMTGKARAWNIEFLQ